MKLKVKTSVATASKAPARGTQVTKLNVDKYSAYNAPRVAVLGALTRKVVGTPIPASMKHKGYLLVTGESGVLIREVKHDGKGLYQRQDDQKWGSLGAFNSLGRKDLTARIVSGDELIALARTFNKPMEVTHVKSKARLQVLPLNSFGDKYVAAVTVKDGQLVVLNMEHPEAYNKKEVQYADPKNLKLDTKKFFASL